ncbi:hypothetical protein RM51_04155 [Chryseobacterium taiwanense]|uniref:Uncharacterized protein n=1 Tax=Chryseobacterium taiwanense TaxID=363331 RepID=A0A0B4CRT8_9FLAO|nr:hypothetical protein RM51_04155 [Chryseobacterium taiwanense]
MKEISVFLYFLRKKFRLAVPIKSVIISEISKIGKRKAKITAKIISGCKSRQERCKQIFHC